MNTEKMHFKIFGEQTGKVLDASLSNAGEVVLWESNGGDNQLWYWDGIDRDILRNKMFPNKALDFDWINFNKYGWGKVYLNESNDGGWNQKWQFDRSEFACKGSGNIRVYDLRLVAEVHNNHNGAKVGVYYANGGLNQHWKIQIQSV